MSESKGKTRRYLERIKNFMATMAAVLAQRAEMPDQIKFQPPAVETGADEGEKTLFIPLTTEQFQALMHDQIKFQPQEPEAAADEDAKPLFIPLKTEYFQAFQDGSKTEELRLYGPGWNEKTCVVGRAVVLSKGYGKQERLQGRISSFKKQEARSLRPADRKAIRALYQTLDIEIAVIAITGLEPVIKEGE